MFWPLQILFHFIIAPNFYSSRTIYSLVSWSIPLANSSRLLTRPSSSFLNHYHELKTRKFEHLIYKYNLIDQINQTIHNQKEMWDYVCRAHLLRQDTSRLFFPCFFSLFWLGTHYSLSRIHFKTQRFIVLSQPHLIHLLGFTL